MSKEKKDSERKKEKLKELEERLDKLLNDPGFIKECEEYMKKFSTLTQEELERKLDINSETKEAKEVKEALKKISETL